MERKTIPFDLNEFLRFLSPALDLDEQELFGIPANHSKRIAMIALKIARQVYLSDNEIADIVSLSLLHDNGASPSILHHTRDHCQVGQDNIRGLPLASGPKTAILHHHENYDGSGLFRLTGQEIPLMSQILRLADQLSLHFDLGQVYDRPALREPIFAYVKKDTGTLFSPETADAFLHLSSLSAFWFELTDPVVDQALRMQTPGLRPERTWQEIREITRTVAAILDGKSGRSRSRSVKTAECLLRKAAFHRLDEDTEYGVLIAADLLDCMEISLAG